MVVLFCSDKIVVKTLLINALNNYYYTIFFAINQFYAIIKNNYIVETAKKHG